MVTIKDGPGDFDLAYAFIRGGIVEIKLDDGTKFKLRFPSRKDIDLTGAEIQVGKEWLLISAGSYSPHLREGVIPEMEESQVCGHLMPKNVHICPVCGRNNMDVG